MSLQGTINKCFVLLFLLVLSSAWVWGKVTQPVPMMEGLEEQAIAQAAVLLHELDELREIVAIEQGLDGEVAEYALDA